MKGKKKSYRFSSLKELGKFDKRYTLSIQRKILKNITSFFSCEEGDISYYQPIQEGLTNTSFLFEIHNEKYVYRHPGEGTNQIISREHEKQSLELAKSFGIDPTYLFMDEKEGWKISRYVEGIRVPDYHNFEDSKRVIGVLRNLHQQKWNVDWCFHPFENACEIESLLIGKDSIVSSLEFQTLKENVWKCYQKCRGDGVEERFCHCDTYAPNWMLNDEGDTILIDWEYAGNADPGCDVGTYIMDSMWDVLDAEKFIKEYCKDSYCETLRFHYLAYTAILSYYWYVWALYREASGALIGQSLVNWHLMAEKYSSYLVLEFSL